MNLREAERTGIAVEVAWPFKDSWSDHDIRQRRLYRLRVNACLNHWLVIQAVREVGTADTFSTFRRWYNLSHHVSIERIAADIANVSSAYQPLEIDELNGVSREIAYR